MCYGLSDCEACASEGCAWCGDSNTCLTMNGDGGLVCGGACDGCGLLVGGCGEQACWANGIYCGFCQGAGKCVVGDVNGALVEGCGEDSMWAYRPLPECRALKVCIHEV